MAGEVCQVGVKKKNPSNDQQIECQRHALPDRQRQWVGHRRQRRREAEEIGRIMPAVELGIRAEDGLLTGVLPGGCEGSVGLAAQDTGARGIDIGEIGSGRQAEAVVEAGPASRQG